MQLSSNTWLQVHVKQFHNLVAIRVKLEYIYVQLAIELGFGVRRTAKPADEWTRSNSEGHLNMIINHGMRLMHASSMLNFAAYLCKQLFFKSCLCYAEIDNRCLSAQFRFKMWIGQFCLKV